MRRSIPLSQPLISQVLAIEEYIECRVPWPCQIISRRSKRIKQGLTQPSTAMRILRFSQLPLIGKGSTVQTSAFCKRQLPQDLMLLSSLIRRILGTGRYLTHRTLVLQGRLGLQVIDYSSSEPSHFLQPT